MIIHGKMCLKGGGGSAAKTYNIKLHFLLIKEPPPPVPFKKFMAHVAVIVNISISSKVPLF